MRKQAELAGPLSPGVVHGRSNSVLKTPVKTVPAVQKRRSSVARGKDAQVAPNPSVPSIDYDDNLQVVLENDSVEHPDEEQNFASFDKSIQRALEGHRNNHLPAIGPGHYGMSSPSSRTALPPLIGAGHMLEEPMYHYKYSPHEVHGEEDEIRDDGSDSPKKTLAKRYYISKDV